MSHPMHRNIEDHLDDLSSRLSDMRKDYFKAIDALKSIRAECNLSILAEYKRECLIVIDSIGRKAQAAIDIAEGKTNERR